MAILKKLRWALQRRRREADLRDELAFHLDAEAEERRAVGLSEEEAQRAARRDLGNLARVQEDTRAAWGLASIERLGQDVRYAFRIVRRRPGFTAAALVTLALGIGANTAVFSILHALLLESLPVGRPRELVQLIEQRAQSATPYEAFTYSTYETLRDGTRQLAGVAAASAYAAGRVEERGERIAAVAQLASDNYFEVLEVSAFRGRVFRAPTPAAPGEPIAVISEAFWRQHYGADPNALGARLSVNTKEFTVAGVAPPGFRGIDLEQAVDVWIPFDQSVPLNSPDRKVGRWVRIFGRLADPARVAQVDAEGSAILGRPVTFRSGATGYSTLRRRLFQPLLLVELVVGLVLLITCVNLANLTMSGNLARTRELAVRRALGASRARIVRQLMTESLLLAVAGGASALVAAYWISAALLSFLPPAFAPAQAAIQFQLDLRVLGFAALLSCATCMSFALVPALRAAHADASPRLGARGSTGDRVRSWASRGLVIGEVAMCALLLLVAGVFLRSVQNLRAQDSGYKEAGLLVADVAFHFDYGDERRDLLIEELRARVVGLPGVDIVGYSHLGQLSGGAFEYRIGFPGQPYRREDAPIAIEQRVSPGFLAAMGARLSDGRDFAFADTATSKPVAIVNELFASRFFPGRNPIGQSFFQDGGSRSREPMEIVGVAQNSKWVNLRSEPPAMYYRPYAQQGGTPVVRFAIRGSSDPDTLAAALVTTAQAIDRRTILTNVVPFREIVNRSLLIERLVAYVAVAFGMLAVLIVAVGLYGILAYSVTRRRREIGVRIAVGASRASVEWMFLRESLTLLAVGLVLGIPPGILVIRLVSSLLYGLGPQDPSAIASAALALFAATAAASYLPARRAASIDPVVALREE